MTTLSPTTLDATTVAPTTSAPILPDVAEAFGTAICIKSFESIMVLEHSPSTPVNLTLTGQSLINSELPINGNLCW
jgi:hypothetical protein